METYKLLQFAYMPRSTIQSINLAKEVRTTFQPNNTPQMDDALIAGWIKSELGSTLSAVQMAYVQGFFGREIETHQMTLLVSFVSTKVKRLIHPDLLQDLIVYGLCADRRLISVKDLARKYPNQDYQAIRRRAQSVQKVLAELHTEVLCAAGEALAHFDKFFIKKVA